MADEMGALRDRARTTCSALLLPLRVRSEFSPQAMRAYEEAVAEFVSAAVQDGSERTQRLAAELMSDVGRLSTQAEFETSETRATLEVLTGRLRVLLEQVLGPAEATEP